MAKVKGGLGKGLGALFVDNQTDSASPVTLAIGEIEPNRDQPRKTFEPGALADLADSIREYGVLQPLVVRPLAGQGYQLVAGERRWRAARMAGLSDVPVVIRELSDAQVMEIALIENLQREDLNPIEEAAGYRDLMETFGLTQEQVSTRVGKSRPAVTNAIRLLNLPEQVQEQVRAGKLSTGHARALLSLDVEDDELCRVADEVMGKGLSVRQVESMGQQSKPQKPAKEKQKNAWNQSFYAEVELALAQSLGRKIEVSGKNGKGKLTVEFYNEDDLRTLAELLDRPETKI